MFALRNKPVSVTSTWSDNYHNAKSTRVTINQGELQGSLECLKSGKTFASFKGIPYAKPPIGELRFKAPQPAEGWNGIRDATKHGPICPQYDMASLQILQGEENCLFINVYTPNVEGPPYPVMLYIHGGGFQSGSGNSSVLGPEYLLEEDVVLVTMNYRLEALGFLCLDTEEVPGNAGLKDQVMAMRWVKDNIASFGGDPENITLFGESAGGISVTYHMVSPMSKGLFHRALTQSGAMFNDWGITYDSVARGFRLGKYLGIDTKDVKELTEYLRSLPSTKLIKVNYNTISEEEAKAGFPLYYCPVIEKSFPGQEAFLPKPPMELIAEGHLVDVPLIIGYNSAEGLMISKNVLMHPNKNLSRTIPREIHRVVSHEKLLKLGDEVKKFYFGDEPIHSKTVPNIVLLETDNHFSMGIQKFGKIVARINSSPVYLYVFNFDGEVSQVKRSYSKIGKVPGACHVDDLFYLFKTPLKITEGSDSWRTMKRMTKMWTNFAKFSNPTPLIDELIRIRWIPLTRYESNFLKIDTDLIPGVNPDNERYEFWKNIFDTLPDDHHIVKFP